MSSIFSRPKNYVRSRHCHYYMAYLWNFRIETIKMLLLKIEVLCDIHCLCLRSHVVEFQTWSGFIHSTTSFDFLIKLPDAYEREIHLEKSLNTIIMHCSWHKTSQCSVRLMEMIFPRHFNVYTHMHSTFYRHQQYAPAREVLSFFFALRTIMQLVSIQLPKMHPSDSFFSDAIYPFGMHFNFNVEKHACNAEWWWGGKREENFECLSPDEYALIGGNHTPLSLCVFALVQWIDDTNVSQ